MIFDRERLLLEKLRNRPHNHIVTHLTSIMDEDTFYILFPPAQCDLRAFFNQKTAPISQNNVVPWFFSQLRGLADAVLHLHALGDSEVKRQWTLHNDFIPSRPVLHGDIKPENILVFASSDEASWGTFKLSDFGSAQTSDNYMRSLLCEVIQVRGTEAYESPDLLNSSKPTCATDVWSLGCVFLELLVWLFYPPGSDETGFMTQRSSDPCSHNSSFWRLTESGKVDLKQSVGRRLLDLEYTPCCGKLAFEYLLQLIWDILIPRSEDRRYSALRLLNDIDVCIDQAEFDLARGGSYVTQPLPYLAEGARRPSWYLYD
jgi:serine/threonine protein kinase